MEFREFVKRMANAKYDDELARILMDTDGVEDAYMVGKITEEDRNFLYELASQLWSDQH